MPARQRGHRPFASCDGEGSSARLKCLSERRPSTDNAFRMAHIIVMGARTVSLRLAQKSLLLQRRAMNTSALADGLAHQSQSDTVSCSRGRDAVSAVDNLMLDAKQAILDEQHRRFRALQQEGRWSEAMKQFHVTLGCASDLLNESL